MATRNWMVPPIIILALVARFLPGARTIDDAYITFRYARNIISGQGFVFNPGEHVQGTTTPIYALIMSGLGLITGGKDAPFPYLSLWINAVSDALTCLLLWQIGVRIKAEIAGTITALIWSIAPFSVTFAIGGLETSVYVLFLTGMTWAYLTRKRSLTASLAALALLTRPDALILVGPLMLDRLFRARRSQERIQIGEVLWFTIPCLTWAIFATFYFGSPIPHSVQAKLAVYRLGPSSALIRLLQHYATPFFEQNFFGTAWIALGLILYPFLYLIGARQAYKVEPRLLAFLVYPWLYLIVFSAPNPLIFRWYLTPPLPAYFLCIFAGAENILKRVFSKKPDASPASIWRQALPITLILILPLFSTLSEWQIQPDHGPNRPAPSMAWFKLELLYQQATELIKDQIRPGQTIAAGDVGVLGYYTDARILDTVGLNSPKSLQYYPLDERYYVINYAIPSKLILEQEPDWIVVLEVYGRNTFLKDQTFLQKYHMVATLPTDIYGSQGMLIFNQVQK